MAVWNTAHSVAPRCAAHGDIAVGVIPPEERQAFGKIHVLTSPHSLSPYAAMSPTEQRL
jgi:hypothetical protein